MTNETRQGLTLLARLLDVRWNVALPRLVLGGLFLLVLFAPSLIPTTPFAVHDDDDGDGLFNEDGDQDGRDDDNDGFVDEESGPGTGDVVHDNGGSGIDFGAREIDLEANVTTFVDWVQDTYRVQTQAIKENLTLILEGENQPRSEPEVIDGLEEFLLADQVRVFLLMVCAAVGSGLLRVKTLRRCGWRDASKDLRSYGLSVFAIVGLMLIDNMALWEATMESLALIVGASIVSLLVGLPMGILSAYSRWAELVIRPVLDLMQTMPAFVYLIPAIVLFSTGIVSATLATVIFAVPPLVRLTAHGIRSVDQELVEAGRAFGAGPMERLVKIELPMARPTIFVGINQMIMLSLSMVVIAALIGAEGLGNEIMRAINRINPGKGFEAGLAIVILAVYLDRLVGAFGVDPNA